VLGVASGIVLKLLMKSVVLPLLGADPINRSYQFLAGNTAMLPLAVIAMLNAGFAEETTTRGFLFERFGKGIGTSVWARVATVLITSIYFGLGHTSQGFWGVVQGTMTGLVFGTTYALTGNLFLVMITHASFDLTALALIYSGNEARVAHWFVR